ncbi:DUF6541 family protein [Arthrobacter sp. NPDC056727]|uniref:DUF6541 family protein n=1 Tax=Arthrobacter sp. NPDC056727 TaxID=3345927 RepID=UPI003672B2DE
MLDWLSGLTSSAPTVVFLVTAFFLPGLLVLLPLKPGWPAAIALSPAVTLLMLLAGSFATAALGLPWNAATAALTALPLVLLAWLAGRRFALGQPLAPGSAGLPTWLAVGAATALGSAVTCLALLRGIGDPATASQGWDPIFHLNALRWIQESGQATPWSIAPIFGAGRATYYPAGWHSAVALVPGSVSEAANLSSIVIGGLIWPAGLAFLATAVLPRHPAAWALTPLVGASFISFPFSQLLRSGQWPNGLATALVPATLALAVLLLRRVTSAGTPAGPTAVASAGPSAGPSAGRSGMQAGTRAGAPARGHIPLAIILVAVLGGCAAAHPSALFAIAVAVLPFVAARFLPLLVRGVRRRPLPTLAAVLVAVLLAAAAWSVLANSRLLAGVMAYRRAVRAAVPDSLYLAFFDLPRFPALSPPAPDDFNIAVGLLVILGAVVAVFVREARPLAATWLAFVGLYVLAAGPENGLRWLTGFWYKDTQRIAPFIAMAGSLLAALAIAVVTGAAVRAVMRVISARPHEARPAAGRWPVPAILFTVAAAAVTGALYVGSGSYRSVERVAVSAQNYTVSDKPGAGVLSSGEQAFIERAGSMLPDDAVVIGDPFNGETYFYALTGRHVVYTQLGAPTAGSAAKELLRTGFNRLAADPAVCDAVRKVGATYFYEDAPGGSHGSVSLKRWPGFYNVPTEQGFEKVASAEGRTLYRITACR